MSRRFSKWPLEWVLLASGTLLLARGASGIWKYAEFQHAATERVIAPGMEANKALLNTAHYRTNEPRSIAVINVPRLHMSVAVVEGVDEDSLSIGAGHMPGTASPGQKGNSVIAGHRDLSFHPLRKIRVGDVIELQADRTYTYLVDHLSVADPDNTGVLASGPASSLTLITCYPFGFIGSAPKRFIVHAKLAKA